MAARLSRVDPVVWFLVLGGAIFALNALTEVPPREVIEINPGMAAEFRQSGDPDAALRRYVEEEILLREAVARGLPLRDATIRGQLIDRMEFLLETEPPEPAEADLERLMAADPDRYRTPRLFSFEHRYFGEDHAAAEVALNAWRAGEAMLPEGPAVFWMGETLDDYTQARVQKVMGDDFAARLPELEQGVWAGPVKSARGWHLVRLTGGAAPVPLPPAELDRRLAEDWRAYYQREAREEALTGMRARYDIRLPAPDDAGAQE